MAAKRIKLSGTWGKITEADFFKQSCESLAKSLLGCVLVHRTDEGVCSGKIVETEAYLGGEDKGAHSYQGQRTAKNESMYLPPGTSYVYHVYGRYCCYNVSSQGEGAAVLVRALEPMKGTDIMLKRRSQYRQSGVKEVELCNGPSKLTQALGITRAAVDGVMATSSDSIWIERATDEVLEFEIVSGPRIGIDYAGPEWSVKPLRFYIKGNQFVSCLKAGEKTVRKRKAKKGPSKAKKK